MINTRISLRDNLSQSALILSEACYLACRGCDIWQKNSFSRRRMGDLSARCVNVLGGDPFLDHDLFMVLKQLKFKQKKIRLWTHLLCDQDAIMQAVPYVDEWMVYLPVTQANFYRKITGYNVYTKLLKQLDLLVQYQAKLTLNMPVYADTLTFVPDVHNLARTLGSGLLLHYSVEDFEDQESLFYLKRYNRVKNVFVFQVKQRDQSMCLTVPTQIFSDRMPWLYHAFCQRFVGFKT
eukprot:COSAG01_NODE_69_length_28801_cov_10.460038_24_plen_236_part_00